MVVVCKLSPRSEGLRGASASERGEVAAKLSSGSRATEKSMENARKMRHHDYWPQDRTAEQWF
jgi:hypothetical protein